MKCMMYILIVILVIAGSGSGSAQVSRDEQAVRKVLNRELKGALTGNPEQVLSCYADDYVGYMAWTDSVSVSQLLTVGNRIIADPEDWTIFISSPQELKEYSARFRGGPERMAKYKKKYPGAAHSNEIRSVTLKGDHAIAVSKHWTTIPNPSKQQKLRWEMRTVWMIDKINGQWKISRAISGVVRAQIVETTYPQ